MLGQATHTQLQFRARLSVVTDANVVHKAPLLRSCGNDASSNLTIPPSASAAQPAVSALHDDSLRLHDLCRWLWRHTLGFGCSTQELNPQPSVRCAMAALMRSVYLSCAVSSKAASRSPAPNATDRA